MAVLYRIVGWDDIYENSTSRQCQELHWVKIPNKHDSDGYTQIVEHPNGAGHYACWVTIVQVASKCRPRGCLLRGSGPTADRQPHDSASLARVSRLPEALFSEAIPRFLEVGWLEVVATEGDTADRQPSDSRVTADRQPTDSGLMCRKERKKEVRKKERKKGREEKRREEKGREARAPQSGADQDLADWCNWWNGLHRDKLVSAAVRTGNPSEGVLAGWRRVNRSTDLRTLLLENRESLRHEIRQSSFCRKPWFRLEKLFGGKNPDGELIVQKLLDGGYRDDATKRPGGIGYDPDGPHTPI